MKGTSFILVGVVIIAALAVSYTYVQQIQAQEFVVKVVLSPNLIRLRASAESPLIDLELIENTDNCLVDCYAIIKLHTYQDTTIPSSANAQYKWEFLKAKPEMEDLLSSSFEILKNVSYTKATPTFKLVTKHFEKPIITNSSVFSVPDGCSDTNSTHYSCNANQVTGITQETLTKEEYQPFSFWGETFKEGQDYYLKVRGTKKASVGKNNVEWMPTLKGVKISEWSWWNTTWQYKKQVNVTDTSNTAFTDYPVVISNFNCGNNCNSSGKDIRLVANDAKELQFGLQKINDSYYNIAFWANVTTANGTNSSYYVYYGNPIVQSANRSWNISRFNYYDNFDSGSLSGNITVHNGTGVASSLQAYSGSYSLKLEGDGSANGFATLVGWNITDTGVYLEAVKFDGSGDVASWNGFTLATPELRGTDGFVNSMRAVWHASSGGRLDHRWYNPSAQENLTSEATSCGLNLNTWHTHDAWWFRNNYTLSSKTGSCNLTTNSTSSVTIGESTGRIGLTTHPQASTYFDDLAFRKLLYPEPTISVGEEATAFASESDARSAIIQGIQQSSIEPSPLTYTDMQIYVRTSNNTQNLGTFDKVAIYGNQRWAFNYVTSGESFTNLTSLGQTLNIWENQSLTSSEIITHVSTLINATKQ